MVSCVIPPRVNNTQRQGRSRAETCECVCSCLPCFDGRCDGQTPFVLLSLEGGEVKRDDKDVLPRQKCLDALAALRHAKWFQVHSPLLYVCALHTYRSWFSHERLQLHLPWVQKIAKINLGNIVYFVV